MRKIVISTFGSFGDVHPYIAVALELKRRGHRPVIATSEIYREKLDALGLELHPVPPDLPGYDRPEEVARMIGEMIDPKKGPELVFTKFINPYLRGMYDALADATRDADLLVTHILSLAGPPLVEKTGIPWVSTVLAPISLFSNYDPPVFPNAPWVYHVLKLHPSVSRTLMRAARWKLDQLAAPLYKLRAELGLKRGGNPMLEGQHSPRMVLALFSSAIAPRQPDWPPQTRVTGFPFYDRRDRAGDEEERLDPNLLKFLDAGEPPVVF